MSFNAEKSLFELPIVRWIASVAFVAAIVVTVVIAAHAKEPFAWDGESVSHGVDLFKVPLGILAVGLTLIGICGANHRSEQTKKQIARASEQISLTQNQNKFSNHYKHIEEFEKYCNKQGASYEIKSVRALYNDIFPKSRDGNYKISEEFRDKLSAYVDKFIALCSNLEGFAWDQRDEYNKALIQIGEMREEFLKFAYMKDSPEGRTGKKIVDGNKFVIIPGGNLRGLFDVNVKMLSALNNLLKFDLDYKTPEALMMLEDVSLDFIPDISVTQSLMNYNISLIRKNYLEKSRT